ncbi:MAG: DnaJ domain-containing protein [Geminicoccaceae bacterium]|nr:DnaJ domain-containing protein [Geminicoccaceae bacterium]
MDAVDDPKGYYRALGVRRSASAEEIRAAFREKARLYHPDSGSPLADEARFAQLVEAYETLRDPERRRAYDAAGFERTRERAEKAAAAGLARRPPRLVPRERGRLLWPSLLFALGLVALGLFALWWSAERRLALRDHQIEELSLRLAEALAVRADTRTPYRAQTVAELERVLQAGHAGGFPFAVEIEFAPGSAELDSGARGQLERAVVDLAAAIARIPAGRDWVVLVESFSARAVTERGVDVEAWGKALRRLAVVVEGLARRGLPAERLATRFQAGTAPVDARSGEGRVVAVKLVCCFGPD